LLITSLLALSLAACTDGDSMPGSDGGTTPPPGSDTGTTPPPGSDSGTMPPPGSDGGGPLPSAPEVDIEVAQSCEDLAPCGGDVIGTWAYTDGCVEVDLSDIEEACPAATVDVTATASGVVRVDALTIEREGVVHSEATIGVPASCAFLGCAMIADLLAGSGDASCTDVAGGGCDCTLRSTDRISEIDGYRLEGNSLITDDGGIYDYCRDGSTILYADRDDQDVLELSPL